MEEAHESGRDCGFWPWRQFARLVCLLWCALVAFAGSSPGGGGMGLFILIWMLTILVLPVVLIDLIQFLSRLRRNERVPIRSRIFGLSPYIAGTVLVGFSLSGYAQTVRFALSRPALERAAQQTELEGGIIGLYWFQWISRHDSRVLFPTDMIMIDEIGYAYCPDGPPPLNLDGVKYGSHVAGDWWIYRTN